LGFTHIWREDSEDRQVHRQAEDDS
jgi:hypothetical protein